MSTVAGLTNMTTGYRAAACSRLMALPLTSSIQCLPYNKHRAMLGVSSNTTIHESLPLATGSNSGKMGRLLHVTSKTTGEDEST